MSVSPFLRGILTAFGFPPRPPFTFTRPLRRPSRVRPLTEEERDIAEAERLMNDPAQVPVDYEDARRELEK